MQNLRVCVECYRLTRNARCEEHARPKDSRHGWATQHGHNVHRMRGRALQRERMHLFSGEPFCRACSAQGQLVLATIRDHIIPLAEGGTDDPSNIQPLCRACSDRKTHAESQRART